MEMHEPSSLRWEAMNLPLEVSMYLSYPGPG
jgi:hypothetical protein